MEWDEGWTLNAAFGARMFFILVLGDRDLVALEWKNKTGTPAWRNLNTKYQKSLTSMSLFAFSSDCGSNLDSVEIESIKASK